MFTKATSLLSDRGFIFLFLPLQVEPSARKGIWLPVLTRYLPLIAVLGNMWRSQSFRELGCFATRHNDLLSQASGFDQWWPPSDSVFCFGIDPVMGW